MKNLKWILYGILINLFFYASNVGATEELLIYGGERQDQFLGCLNCNEFDEDSICNSFGQFGNELSSIGMFNEFSTFGNEFNSSSPWNEFSQSSSVPVILDASGNFYGYFTINEFRQDAIDFSNDLKKMYEYLNGDLEKVRVLLCESLGFNG